MITQKDKAEQFKRDLRSWRFYEGMIREYDLKLEEIGVHLQGVGSLRTDVIRSTNGRQQSNFIFWLMEEETCIKERKEYCDRIARMDEVLAKLEEEEQNLIMDLYVKNKRHENVADSYHMNRQNMYKKVDKMLFRIL